MRGFRCERLEVPTEDGYVLALIHVLGREGTEGAEDVDSPDRPPVLVQHGMLMSSDAWLFRRDNDNLRESPTARPRLVAKSRTV